MGEHPDVGCESKITLRIVPGEQPFQHVGTSKNPRCSHWHSTFVVDPDARSVRCRQCDREVDPYFAMSEINRAWTRCVENLKHLKNQEQEATRRVIDLLRKERNAKQRLRSLGRRLTPPPP